ATNEEEQPVVSKHSSKKRIALKRLVISLGTVFVLSLIAYTTILYGGKLFVDENKLPVSGPTSIQNENGETVWQLYEQYRKPVTLEEIPEDMQNAFVATEDKRFYTHSGVDFRSIMRALYKDIIRYGGKLFVDENKLPVSGPTSIQNENGETVWQLYEQYRKPVTLEEIPEDMQNAFVATEDKRFYTHSGVDFRSIMRALYKDII